MRIVSCLLLLLLLAVPQAVGQTRHRPLPEIVVSRRADVAYMDSLARVAKQQYHTLTALPRTPVTDTVRFRALNYLGSLYKLWNGRRDSIFYFGTELAGQARKSRNLFYEVNGKLLLESYYRTVDPNLPLALRLNFDILTQLRDDRFYDIVRYRVFLNLGDLYGISRNFASAIRYLNQAKNLVAGDLPTVGPALLKLLRVEVEQHLGAIYKQQDKFAESEQHYLIAESLLVTISSITAHAYVFDDLGELYLKDKQYDKALHYAKKAEVIWDRVKPPTESHSWGTLSCVYAGLGRDELAWQYAQKALRLPKPTKFVQEQAYMALYQVSEHRRDWQNSALYFRKYIAVRDTIANDQRSLEVAAIQKQAEFDRFTLQKQTEFDQFSLQNRQAQQLQAQRLLTVEKQGELNQLRANTRADALIQQARLAEQQRLVDNVRAQTALTRQRIDQKLQQQTYRQQAGEQQRTRTGLLVGLIGLLLFTLVLSIVYGKNRAQQRQIAQLNADLEKTVQNRTAELLTANAELQQKNQAILAADARIMAAQETERQRIAADLHDDLGGTLATIHRCLTDLRQHIRDPEVSQQFDALQPLIQKSSADLRRIAHNLMPPEFTRIGLPSALEHLVHSQPREPTRFTFITSGIRQKLPTATELNAYRIVSELIQNISKHARANRAAVQLIYQDDRLTITVEDDGLGSRAAVSTPELAGIGLITSRLRADYMGANLWREVSEGGTLVVLEVPYRTEPGSAP